MGILSQFWLPCPMDGKVSELSGPVISITIFLEKRIQSFIFAFMFVQVL